MVCGRDPRVPDDDDLLRHKGFGIRLGKQSRSNRQEFGQNITAAVMPFSLNSSFAVFYASVIEDRYGRIKSHGEAGGNNE